MIWRSSNLYKRLFDVCKNNNFIGLFIKDKQIKVIGVI